MGACFSRARRRDTKQVPIVPECFETRPERIRKQRDTRAKRLKVFPTAADDPRNTVICVPGSGNRKDFGVLAAKFIPALDLAFEKVQCFPFYTYAEDGSNRRENITDWALEQFRVRYGVWA